MTVPAGVRGRPRMARRLGVLDTGRVLARVVAPTVAEGPVLRRRGAMALAERFQWDARAIGTVRRLRQRHGTGPLRLRLPGRFAGTTLVLDPEDVREVLAGTPSPFTPASAEKRAALGQFQPHGSLITTGGLRGERRRINEEALDAGHPLHRSADRIAATAGAGARAVTGRAAAAGELTWDAFEPDWWRAVRTIVLGPAARDETAVTELLERLRAAGNWSFLRPRRRVLRARFQRALRGAAADAGPDSLAAALPPAASVAPGADPQGQIAHWLFAYDAAGIATLRTLALLATHPAEAARARREAADGDPARARELPFLRACVLESLRLWPTTPLLLRESTEDGECGGVRIPAGASLLLYTPYLHRAGSAAPYGEDFVPGIWLDGRAADDPALVPFSAGPARCPGRDVVLLTVTAWLAAALTTAEHELLSRPRPGPGGAAPATLDHFTLRFAVRPR